MSATASFEALTPTSFLLRSGKVYADRDAVIDGERRFSYAEFLDRCLRLGGALRGMGIAEGGRVAVLAPNTHVLLEAHYGIPFAGAVLVALNTRLTAADLSFIVAHSGAQVLVYDYEFEGVARDIAAQAGGGLRLVRAGRPDDQYEHLLAGSGPYHRAVTDERGLLSINYTSGTTGKPKGVMYHHRGAYLQALAMAMETRLECDSTFLWTLPMFHCNGWCFPWGVTAAGAAHLCLRKFDPGVVWKHLRESNVTHLNGAPTVLVMLAWHPAAARLAHTVRVATGGAPPTPAILQRMAELGMDVTHLYGLTETFGPAVICEWRGEWSKLTIGEQARIKARQGVGNVVSQQLRVVDLHGKDVPENGKTLGEVALRGNNVMLGYYQDEIATRKAIPDGWLRTGDLGVMHPDGYVEIKDRAKDIIVSGGENIASIEVERALCAHSAVMEAAVVAGPDPKWGEVPIAFVTLKSGAVATEDELVAYLRERLAHFKAPRRVVFGELPRNATGKIQKFVLRDRARELMKSR
ncbi:MAG: AMP-binding protein [Betaproteobacteria bacterium]|nr:AMP-binding protein [Betaproteobacteria bacterium]MBI2509746.1 AMP-binding protein [Betaproteobacteria bacterium]